jgi:hypothetical protein
MKRAIAWLASVAVVLTPALLAVNFLTPHQFTPGVTRANFERLHEGMTMEEVEEILGKDEKESREYGFGPGVYVGCARWDGPEEHVRIWYSGPFPKQFNQGKSRITDGEFMVGARKVSTLAPADESFLAMLRRLLRL